ncbi:hypothetical protein [Streptomyces sp. Agncl-13]|uniref:hypothetical protein n=1 Tax=Streptomyces sp. Agncl-13 TaxID=3400628 RepID=UPI003A83B448
MTGSGRLTAVIDFGCLGGCDPAADALPAWALFSAGTCEVFREAGEFEDEVGVGHRAVRETLEDFGV